MATIRDVARKALVSNSTVSNVLNGRTGKMTQETLARVQAAMTALEYSPSYAARSLKTGHSALIGLLVPSTANPWFGEIAARIEEVARRRFNCHILLGNTQRDQRSEEHFIGGLQSFGVRGMIVMSALADEAHLLAAARQGMVVVSYDRRQVRDEESVIDHITVDNYHAGYLACQHLVENGHRKLAFVSAQGRSMNRAERIEGFHAAAREAGVGAQVIEARSSVGFGDAEWVELGARLAHELAGPARSVTGVVTVNGMLAISLLGSLRELGLLVPTDVSVVGIDDILISSVVSPPITSVHIPVESIAEAMVERIVARYADPELAPGEFIHQPKLVVRSSVAPRNG